MKTKYKVRRHFMPSNDKIVNIYPLHQIEEIVGENNEGIKQKAIWEVIAEFENGDMWGGTCQQINNIFKEETFERTRGI